MKSSDTCLRRKSTVKNAVEVCSVDGDVAVKVSVIGGGWNHFAQDAGITVGAISRIPERKAHLF